MVWKEVNMEMLSRIGMLILAITILIGGSGCMNKEIDKNNQSSKDNSAEKIKNEALNYLNNNYSDHFSPKGLEIKNWSKDYDTITFTSEKYDNQYVHVFRKKVNDKYTFSDDYFKLTMSKDANSYFKNMINPILGDVITKVDFNNTSLPKKLNKKSTFDEYLDSGEVFIELYVFGENISEATTKTKYMEVINELINRKMRISISFIAINSSDKEKVKSQRLEDTLSSASEIFLERKDFIIKNDFSVKELETNY